MEGEKIRISERSTYWQNMVGASFLISIVYYLMSGDYTGSSNYDELALFAIDVIVGTVIVFCMILAASLLLGATIVLLGSVVIVAAVVGVCIGTMVQSLCGSSDDCGDQILDNLGGLVKRIENLFSRG